MLELGTWLAIFCTLAVIVVRLLVSLAVVGYFNRVGRRSRSDYIKTLGGPLIGALGQVVIMILLMDNITFLAGADELVVKLSPLYVAIIVLIGIGYALWLRAYAPDRYAAIGHVHADTGPPPAANQTPLVDDAVVDERVVDL